ncbi:MAG: hypothetical protein P8M30_16645 [Planctomycetaceae bacterium]|nr:hypothetical protein [Planctomycetaceae bacterium]
MKTRKTSQLGVSQGAGGGERWGTKACAKIRILEACHAKGLERPKTESRWDLEMLSVSLN